MVKVQKLAGDGWPVEVEGATKHEQSGSRSTLLLVVSWLRPGGTTGASNVVPIDVRSGLPNPREIVKFWLSFSVAESATA